MKEGSNVRDIYRQTREIQGDFIARFFRRTRIDYESRFKSIAITSLCIQERHDDITPLTVSSNEGRRSDVLGKCCPHVLRIVNKTVLGMQERRNRCTDGTTSK